MPLGCLGTVCTQPDVHLGDYLYIYIGIYSLAVDQMQVQKTDIYCQTPIYEPTSFDLGGFELVKFVNEKNA